jgi:hypothetical protein
MRGCCSILRRRMGADPSHRPAPSSIPPIPSAALMDAHYFMVARARKHTQNIMCRVAVEAASCLSAKV